MELNVSLSGAKTKQNKKTLKSMNSLFIKYILMNSSTTPYIRISIYFSKIHVSCFPRTFWRILVSNISSLHLCAALLNLYHVWLILKIVSNWGHLQYSLCQSRVHGMPSDHSWRALLSLWPVGHKMQTLIPSGAILGGGRKAASGSYFLVSSEWSLHY